MRKGSLGLLFVLLSLSVFAGEFNWKDYYTKDDAKRKYIKHTKKQPAFVIYKPSKEWHFIDLEKLKEFELSRVGKDEKERERIQKRYDATYCRMYREEKEAHALLLIISVTNKNAKLDDYLVSIKKNLIKALKNYRLLSDKTTVRKGVVVRFLQYEFSTDKDGKVMNRARRYIFLKNGFLWQLIISTHKDKYEDLKKEFDRLYKKFKF